MPMFVKLHSVGFSRNGAIIWEVLGLNHGWNTGTLAAVF